MNAIRAVLLLLALAQCRTEAPVEAAQRVRFATFNVALNRPAAYQLAEELAEPDNRQARAIAEIIQRVRPDVLLLNEFDHDPEGVALRRFRENYLAVAQAADVEGLDYPYQFTAPVNTGVPTGFDLDNDGSSDGPGDARGFGAFPGQYGMVLLSRHRILLDRVRTFRELLWRDVPDASLPDDPRTAAPDDWYTSDELAALPLSSKSHWDVPIRIDDRVVHVLACHPTPPVFDGPEDRNGRRNHDEIRLLVDYLEPDLALYIRDDAGRRGGLPLGAEFVICGDLNADPNDGDARAGAIHRLLGNPRVQRIVPESAGAAEAARRQRGVNLAHRGPASADTADFDDRQTGNLRLDYVLPSTGLEVLGHGVYWPEAKQPEFERLIGYPGRPPASSDHRLVWVDIAR